MMGGFSMPATTHLTFLNLGDPTGLKFTVEHGGHRALFDFGLEHAPGRAPFSLGLEPRPGRELTDLLGVGSAPRLDGLYNNQVWDRRTAVFISHMHLDHTALVRFLHPDVPLHYPAAMEELRAAVAAAGYMPWRRPPGTPLADRRPLAWGDIEVTPVAIDHDVPGATGYLVRTPDLFLAYTGDHRWHGLHPELTAAFTEAARGADVLIQEGVLLEPEPEAGGPPRLPRMSEQGVVLGFGALLESSPGLVIANLYPMNRERVSNLAALAAAHGRRLVLEPQAAMMAGHTDLLRVDEVRAAPSRFVVQLSYEGLPTLLDLAPPAGSVYAHSNGPPLGPYDPTYEVMLGWVRHLDLGFVHLGSSGHSWPADVARTVEGVAPGLAIPVHSRAPQALRVPGVAVLVPEVMRSYSAEELKTRAQV
jgi:ribonuclease J